VIFTVLLCILIFIVVPAVSQAKKATDLFGTTTGSAAGAVGGAAQVILDIDEIRDDAVDDATALFTKSGLSLNLVGSRIDEHSEGTPEFYEVGKVTRLWTADIYKDKDAWYRYFDSSSGGQLDFHGPKSSGLSVRLVKDAEIK
jgi:hypothetical protein